MYKKQVPVLLLTGYLGSGKTTLVNRILSNKKGIKFAVIVNDIGEVNIDASLIEQGGVVGKKDDSLVALQNGCICCTLKMDLVEQLRDIVAMHRFDYIVIEASGICEPAPIAQTICTIPSMGPEYTKEGTPWLDCIVTVVDALRMKDEFACGDSLVKEGIDDEDIENLVIQQIEFCNIVLLNKASEVSAADLGRVRSVVRALQPKAEIIDCDFGEVDFDKILLTGLFDFEEVATSATWISEIEGHHEEDDDDDEDHDEDHDDDHDEHGHEEHGHHHAEDHDDHDEGHHHEEDDDDDHDHEAHGHHEEGHHHHHHHHHHDEGEAEEYGIGTFVYYRRRPFDANKFDYYVGQKWPKEVIRAKGIIYFYDETDVCYVFEQAGRQITTRNAGLWYATMPDDELAQMMEQDPGLRRDWDPKYGDRMQKLVFIGQHLDREAITKALDECLVEEIRWKDWM